MMTGDRQRPSDESFWLVWLGALAALYVLVVALLAGSTLGVRARTETAPLHSLFHPPAAPRGDDLT